MDWRLALDRRLVNLLSSCRLYHDQTSHIISRCFGNQSHEFEQVKQFKNTLYDGSFEYRLLEELRNYVQHCGLVLSSITFSSRSPSKTYRAVRVRAMLDTKQIERKNFKKTMFDELEKIGELDIRLPVRRYVSAFVSVHARIRAIIEERLKNARTVYVAAVDEFSSLSDPKGNLMWTEEVDCDNNGEIAFFFITTFLSLYDDLFQRNSLVSDISNLFVSNAGHD